MEYPIIYYPYGYKNSALPDELLKASFKNILPLSSSKNVNGKIWLYTPSFLSVFYLAKCCPVPDQAARLNVERLIIDHRKYLSPNFQALLKIRLYHERWRMGSDVESQFIRSKLNPLFNLIPKITICQWLDAIHVTSKFHRQRLFVPSYPSIVFLDNA